MKKTKSGFTIVELLIVIVVIGVLAAITIVAYNGIQMRAENTKTVAAMNDFVKILKLYATENNTYPVETAYPCIGAYPTSKCANVTDLTAACFSTAQVSTLSTFDTKLKQYANNVPQPSIQQMNCAGKNYSGAYYNATTGLTASFVYFLRGNQQCDGVSAGGSTPTARVQQDDVTRCQVYMPNL